ncbi:MAG: peroxiredoxin family protein [Pseudomonadota bacterium]
MLRFASVLAALAFATAIGSIPAAAEESASVAAAELGPSVGAAIPHDLALPRANGETGAFDALVGEKGLALFFVRSVDWCPYCKRQAEDVSKRIAEFEARGLGVAFVSYDTIEKQAKFVEASGFAPALLSDADIEAINAFGIRNETAKEGTRWYGIPHPVTFIIDRDQTIRAKFYEEDFLTNDKSYRNRTAVDVILAGVDAAFSEGS